YKSLHLHSPLVTRQRSVSWRGLITSRCRNRLLLPSLRGFGLSDNLQQSGKVLLKHIGAGSCNNCRFPQTGIVVVGDDDYASPRMFGFDSTSCFEAVDLAQLYIHQNPVGLSLGVGFYSRFPVRAFNDFRAQVSDEPLYQSAHTLVVIGYEYFHP